MFNFFRTPPCLHALVLTKRAKRLIFRLNTRITDFPMNGYSWRAVSDPFEWAQARSFGKFLNFRFNVAFCFPSYSVWMNLRTVYNNLKLRFVSCYTGTKKYLWSSQIRSKQCKMILNIPITEIQTSPQQFAVHTTWNTHKSILQSFQPNIHLQFNAANNRSNQPGTKQPIRIIVLSSFFLFPLRN